MQINSRHLGSFFVALAQFSCLPEELTDAQLKNWCRADHECANRDAYACLVASCVANQCTPTGQPISPKTACKTTTCIANCVCSGPKDAKVGKAGVCIQP